MKDYKVIIAYGEDDLKRKVLDLVKKKWQLVPGGLCILDTPHGRIFYREMTLSNTPTVGPLDATTRPSTNNRS